jgi:pimeloyl-ACP methyl ester carboxylesterase
MQTDRFHRASSTDATQIVGTVEGEGPSLVLVPGGPADGPLSFRFLVPELASHFTCHSMSPRGRGASAGHPDRSAGRLVDDVVAYVESLPAPVTLFGHSSGGVLALEAAARCDAVGALALYEPAIFDGSSQAEAAQLGESLTAIRRAVQEGSWARAAEIFFRDLALANEEEQEVLEATGTYELMAYNIPGLLQEIDTSGLPGLSAADVPERIGVPVLVLCGTRTAPFYEGVARSLVERLPDGHLVPVDGAGHLGPQQHAPSVAAGFLRSAALARV